MAEQRARRRRAGEPKARTRLRDVVGAHGEPSIAELSRRARRGRRDVLGRDPAARLDSSTRSSPSTPVAVQDRPERLVDGDHTAR
jgi:hypothetical protein